MKYFSDRAFKLWSESTFRISFRDLIIRRIDNGTTGDSIFTCETDYYPIKSLIGYTDRESRPYFASTKGRDQFRKITRSNGLIRICEGNFRSSDAVGAGANNINQNIREYIQQDVPNCIIYDLNGGYVRTSYERIASSFFNCHPRKYYLQSAKELMSGTGYMKLLTDQEIIMMIVFKKELYKYHKLFMIENDEFDYSAMELWVLRGLDTPQYKYQGIRRMFRNIMIPMFEEIGLPVVKKENFDEIVARIQLPGSQSINGLLNWKKRLYEKFREKERESTTFDFTSIA